ncbi:MAG: transporter substrate-binding domain-containing protein [Desulfuromonadaceae bacterium]|nr:transporter substrate-binding domain-containing protein [Desulfuromonadaceae bacterium]
MRAKNYTSLNNGRNLFRILIIFIICSAASALLALPASSVSAADGTVIRVGGNRGYPPYEFPDKNGQPTGFTVELLKAIADVMGMTVDIKVGEWAKVHDDLVAGRIDMTLGMSYSEKREKVFDFASPHTVVQHAIFARRGSASVDSLAELKGKKVVVHRNGIMHERLKALGFSNDLLLTETPSEGMRLLASGEGDYAVVALLPGMYIIREYKLTNLVPVARNVASFPFSFAVREGDTELLAHLNEGLAILKKTGHYQVIYDKWLGVLEPARVSWEKVLQYAAMILVPLLLLLTGTIIWSRTLQRKVTQRTEELAQEVAEKNLALDELHRHQDKLMQADKMASLGILVSGVAHEINNPTGLILLNGPTIKEAQQDAETILERYFQEHGDFMYGGIPYSRMREKLPQLLTEMHEGAKRIKRIVEDLKDFARIDQGNTRELFDLNDVLKAALRLVDVTIRTATNQCEVNYTDNLPKVRGTPQRIEQVIINLILNACQSLPNMDYGISLATSCDPVTGTVTLHVRDEGVGIPLEHLVHLSDPFFTTRREAGGTGLGLSVSTAIIKDHGGSLEFVSQPGKGTTVTLTLPTAAEEC